MQAEVLFLKYAFPCSFISLQRGEVTQAEYDEMEMAAQKNKVLPREFLERVFHRAFARMERVARAQGKTKWDVSVIQEYFLKTHNEIIDAGEGVYAKAPEKLKDLCKVHKATVEKIEGDCGVVRYGEKTRTVMLTFIDAPAVGDVVTIHYGYAAERV